MARTATPTDGERGRQLRDGGRPQRGTGARGSVGVRWWGRGPGKVVISHVNLQGAFFTLAVTNQK